MDDLFAAPPASGTMTSASTRRSSTRFARASWLAAASAVGFTIWFGTGLGGHRVTGVAAAAAELVAAAVASVCTGIAARRSRGAWRSGWALVAVSTGAVVIGGLIITGYQVTENITPAFPSPADGPFMTAYIAAIAACMVFLHASGASRARLEAGVETLMITGGLLCLSWETVLIPLLHIHTNAGIGSLSPIVYPIGDIAVGAMIVSLLLRIPLSIRTPILLFAGGMAAIAVWDSARARPLAAGTYLPGGLPDALVVTGYLCLGCAGVWAATHADVDLHAPGMRQAWRLRIVYVPVVLGIGAAILDANVRDRASDPMLLGMVVILMSLIVFRQLLLVRDYVHAVARLSAREEEREQLLHRLLETSDDARRRLAADLHDGVIQLTTALALRSQTLARALRSSPAAAPPRQGDTAARLDHMAADLNAVTQELRTLMGDLADATTQRLGLGQALRELVQPLIDDGIDVELAVDASGADPATQRIVYRSAQELVHNVSRHARARHLLLKVDGDTSTLHLTVSDDGRGFSAQDVERRRSSGGLGLSLLERRINDAGGELRLFSRPGRGTIAEVVMPATRDRSGTPEPEVAGFDTGVDRPASPRRR